MVHPVLDVDLKNISLKIFEVPSRKPMNLKNTLL